MSDSIHPKQGHQSPSFNTDLGQKDRDMIMGADTIKQLSPRPILPQVPASLRDRVSRHSTDPSIHETQKVVRRVIHPRHA